MLIVLDCPGCGKRYEIDAALAGKRSRCKQCGEVFRIPVPTAISAPPPTSKPLRPSHAGSGGGEWNAVLVDPQRTAKPGRGVGPATPSASSAGSGPRTIVLNCPNCQKRYEIDEALAGKKSRCKDCGEVFSIPVPRGRASEPSRSKPAPATPAVPAVWESVLEDEPTSLKASRGSASPADDEFDLPPPPRAAYPQPIRKTSGSHRHRGSGADTGFTIAGCYLALTLLVVMGFFVWMGAAQPESKRVGQVLLATEFFLRGVGLLLSLSGSIWILVIAFSEGLAQGLLCLLVPCYILFFTFSRWEETKGAFLLEVLPFANWLVFFAIGFGIVVSGKTNVLNQVADGDAQPQAVPAPGEPQATLEPQPEFGPPPGFGPQPGFGPRQGFGPPPGFGPRPRFGPRRGPGGPWPGNPQFQPPPNLDARVQQFQAQSGGQSVYFTFSGIPTNSDPARGVTSRDVSEAIRERARALAPGANRFSWVSRNNTSVLMMAPVDDIPGLASRIDFGTATVSGNQIAVRISPDYVASVPRLPAEQSRAAVNPGRASRNSEPEIPPDADAVTKSLIQLKSPETHTRKDGLNRLMRTPPDDRLAEVVQAVIPLLDDDDGWLVGDAIKVLVIWKSPDAVPALIKRTSDNRFTVRHETIKALGKLKDPRGVEPVLLQIKDDGFQVEDALKEMGPIAEPALIERLTNPDSDVRRRVCSILKVVGGKETLKAMQALPKDPEFSVQVAAKDAFSSIVLRVGPLSAAERKKPAGGAGSRRGK